MSEFSENNPRKIYYSIGEVAEMFDVNQSLIRHWEKYFDALKPAKNKKGNRLFTSKDIDILKQIYHLVKERGMRLEHAANYLKNAKTEIDRDVRVVEKLQEIKALLTEVLFDLESRDQGDHIDKVVYKAEEGEQI